MSAGAVAPSGLVEGPLLYDVPAGSTFVRIHQVKDNALWFGPSPGLPPAYRFDAPTGQYRALYGAEQLEGAFAETILRRARRMISRDYVNLRQWSVVRNLRALRLAKVFDEGLIWHGVTADICAGDNYSEAQAFAAELHARYSELDGIAYRARHNNGQICYTLFDRVSSTHLAVVDERRFANEHSVVEGLMRLHNASWDPMVSIPPA